MFEFDMEDYLSPESFALLGGFFVFVFLIWYNEVDRIIFEDNAPTNLGDNHEHRNRNQRKPNTRPGQSPDDRPTSSCGYDPYAAVLTDQSKEEQLAEIKEVFGLFDRNGNGTIPTKDLGTAMRALGLDRHVGYEAMMKKFRSHGKKTIDFPKFFKMVEDTIDNTCNDDDVISAFRVFDRNRSGFIPAADLREIMRNLDQKLTENEMNEIIKMADIDGDGRIDYEEFIQMMNSK